jgi:hypothetical protein
MTGQPASGHMRLYDAAVPPLPDGSYRWTASSRVQKAGTLDETLDRQRFFDVAGPRFTLDPAVVAGVFPPQGAHGPYADSLPQIVLNRRTLPWERAIGPALPPDPLGSGGALPWLALLLFAEGEATLLTQQPLESMLPAGAIPNLPGGIRCDALEVDRTLLAAVMPSVAELQLLAHIRQVNVDDRELNVSRGDGWFSVVVGNRLPAPGFKQRAFLVSLEGRADLIPAQPPPLVDPIFENVISVEDRAVSLGRDLPGGSDVTAVGAAARLPADRTLVSALPAGLAALEAPVRLVCLYSWQFTCEGDANFEGLMQGLDVGMLGATGGAKPVVSDSGHVAITLHDRAGEEQSAWYRGPLVPYQLSRDTQGPYHSADQARRVTPDTGIEDISYSAAFELGRLLAVADGRLAQELMRWRRQGYRAAAFADVVATITRLLPALEPTLVDHLATALAPALGTGLATLAAPHLGPIADAAGLTAALGAPGLQPAELQAAWSLTDAAEAHAILSGDAAVPPLGDGVTGPESLQAAVADAAGRTRLAAARTQLLANARTTLEGTP